jgi:hypothetical protein
MVNTRLRHNNLNGNRIVKSLVLVENYEVGRASRN